MKSWMFMLMIFAMALYGSAATIRLATGNEDTPVWTWPAILVALLGAITVVLVGAYNVFALLGALIGA